MEMIGMLLLLQTQPGDGANQFNGYLILGYFVMWLISMVYIYSLVIRQRNVEKDIRLMHDLLQDDEQEANS